MSVTLQECNNYVDGTVSTCMRPRATDRETVMPTYDAAGCRGTYSKDCGKVRARARVRQGLGQGLAYVRTCTYVCTPGALRYIYT